MMANKVKAVRVLSVEQLPDGVTVLLVPCADHSEFRRLPHVVSRDGTYYGRTGWNSDREVAYFRDDAEVAINAVRANGEDRYVYWRNVCKP